MCGFVLWFSNIFIYFCLLQVNEIWESKSLKMKLIGQVIGRYVREGGRERERGESLSIIIVARAES